LLEGGYAFITAYLKGEEARIVTSGHVNALSRVTRLADITGAIKDTDIGEYLESIPLNTFDDVDRALWDYLCSCFNRLEWFSDLPHDISKIVRAFVIKYDVINIKAALLGLASGRPAKYIPIGRLSDQGLLEDLAAVTDEEAVAVVLGKADLYDYVHIVREFETDGGLRAKLHTEARLEAEYYRNLLAAVESVKDSALITRTLGITIDMKNLQLILRSVMAGLTADVTEHTISGGYLITHQMIGELITLKPAEIQSRVDGTQYQVILEEIIGGFERSGNVSVVDEVIEKHLFRLNREVLSPTVMSPAATVWFLIIKEIEMRNVRLIFKAIMDKLPVDDIKENLVTVS